ncbi:MAG: PD-(D/E)XK nuclease family protein [Bacteroidales bacterium]|nr:PD-(D/E)XK nuclease family protein [Bacteroidales bacterium]MCF8405026.1 PD-(D/E)XK nuclease family protein [Bacteroidales bacterium]
METFLGKTAQYIIDHYSHNMGQTCVVLPNRRAGLFLKRNLSLLIDKPIWAPEVLSIEDFVFHLTELEECQHIKLVFDFYKVYLEMAGEKAEAFTEYLRWAEVVLKDFNDIDLYLVEPKEIYTYLSDSKAISLWNPDNKPLSDFEKNYLQFYRSLESLYFALKRKLLSQNQAYQGLAYRLLAEKNKKSDVSLPWNNLIFAGFNALSGAEEDIIKGLVNTNRARILWDSDPYYTENNLQEAGVFLRKHKQTFTHAEFLWEEAHLLKNPKNIEIVGTAMNIGQVKVAGDILHKIADQNPSDLDHTAIILNDESLLEPMLNSLPSRVDGFNITMGLSLQNNPLYQFLESILSTNENAVRFRKTGSTPLKLYYNDLIGILSHPYSVILFDHFLPGLKPESVLYRLKQSNKAFLSFADLSDYFGWPGELPLPLKAVFNPFAEDIMQGLQQIREILAGLKLALTADVDKVGSGMENKLGMEYLFHFSKMINKLEQFILDFDYIRDLKTFRRFYLQLLRSEIIPFYGQPLKGVQLMGMLESRTLDFKNVIMLSVNEDHLPAGSTDNSILTFEIKRTFKLPTHRDRNAVFAYHFYRLLQRAENVYLIHTSEAGDFGGGEVSRFVRQIEYELPKYNPTIMINSRILHLDEDKANLVKEIKVEKNQDILNRLDSIAKRGFSASALNAYRRCSLQFYFRYIMGISEADEVEETIEASTLGTVVHEVLQNIYQPFINSQIQHENLAISADSIRQEIKKSFAKNYSGGDIEFGKNLLMAKVAESYVLNFIRKERKDLMATTQNLYIERLEKELTIDFQFELNGSNKQVLLRGVIDRIDRLTKVNRIIDYKTGKVEAKELKLSDWDLLLTETRYDKVFQLLFYKLLYDWPSVEKNNTIAGIISMRNISGGFLEVVFPDDGMIKFRNIVNQLLSAIFDDSIPFLQTEKTEDCQYCSFKGVCNR